MHVEQRLCGEFLFLGRAVQMKIEQLLGCRGCQAQQVSFAEEGFCHASTRELHPDGAQATILSRCRIRDGCHALQLRMQRGAEVLAISSELQLILKGGEIFWVALEDLIKQRTCRSIVPATVLDHCQPVLGFERFRVELQCSLKC